jgi:uncharacterized membrane protein (UPF0127 family)
VRAPLLLALGLAACAPCADGQLRITLDGALDVCADVAATEAERREGLAGRPPLEEDEGLWLAFSVEGEVCIVNGDVGYAIDAVYADSANVVQAVAPNIPAGDATARCERATRNVLEVRAGEASGVQPGDILVIE